MKSKLPRANSSVLYMMYEGYVFRKAATMGQHGYKRTSRRLIRAQTTLTAVTVQKMAIDPNNANVVVVGTPENGMFITTNGGASWQSVSAVPVSQDGWWRQLSWYYRR